MTSQSSFFFLVRNESKLKPSSSCSFHIFHLFPPALGSLQQETRAKLLRARRRCPAPPPTARARGVYFFSTVVPQFSPSPTSHPSGPHLSARPAFSASPARSLLDWTGFFFFFFFVWCYLVTSRDRCHDDVRQLLSPLRHRHLLRSR